MPILPSSRQPFKRQTGISGVIKIKKKFDPHVGLSEKSGIAYWCGVPIPKLITQFFANTNVLTSELFGHPSSYDQDLCEYITRVSKKMGEGGGISPLIHYTILYLLQGFVYRIFAPTSSTPSRYAKTALTGQKFDTFKPGKDWTAYHVYVAALLVVLKFSDHPKKPKRVPDLEDIALWTGFTVEDLPSLWRHMRNALAMDEDLLNDMIMMAGQEILQELPFSIDEIGQERLEMMKGLWKKKNVLEKQKEDEKMGKTKESRKYEELERKREQMRQRRMEEDQGLGSGFGGGTDTSLVNQSAVGNKSYDQNQRTDGSISQSGEVDHRSQSFEENQRMNTLNKLEAKPKSSNVDATRVAALRNLLEIDSTTMDGPSISSPQKAKRHTAPNPVVNSKERQNIDKRHQSLPVKKSSGKGRECRNSFAEILAPNPRVSFILGSRDSTQMKGEATFRDSAPPTSPPHMPLPHRPDSRS